MEGNLRWSLVTAVAPIAWGTNYFVTHEHLPAGFPLWGGVLRALPAGLLLLAVRRRRPHGSWWWKSLLLGALNTSVFFTLIYVSAQLLPTSLAAMIMATSPVVLMLLAWLLTAERPGAGALAGAAIGIGGACLMLLTAAARIDFLGVFASVGAMLLSSVGYILAKRWAGEVDVLASTSWQLTFGGLLLVPPALLVEGPPPALGSEGLIAFAYVTVVATAVAFAAWFAGLKHLPAGTVGLLGLLNPVTGVLLGTLAAGDSLTVRQLLGIALVLVGLLLGQPRLRPRRILSWSRLRSST
ncbi:DMT family transporter [Kutzneria buriramensis]|uniref:Putative blue pigment (Indigoidine) exporter n=1 Tax=Kutzneria buriramensis TaxID=1045776 RepID=A0A3E0HEX6_9PSEU|nr:DMT family transporter [Kutzneria buriramensis]REH43821.1 putative blue pigment (indigoidine) exporter [Kutzneria buriramensis]